MRQIIVYGPPCSGKSTYVSEQMGPNDLRYDLDLLDYAISSRTDHTLTKSVGFRMLKEFRNDFIEKTQRIQGDGVAYIIASYLTMTLMEAVAPNSEIVYMDASEETCLARLGDDTSRPDKEAWAELIHEWFKKNKKEKSAMQLLVNKSSSVSGAVATETDMRHINRLALRPLEPEEVYTFRCVACNDQVDRDWERFPVETLEKLAPMFVGKTVLFDHMWSAKGQTARIYRAEVVRQDDGRHDLLVACYMMRNDSTEDIIASIEGGILKETSVGCAVARAECSICGEEYGSCGHRKGQSYDGQLCVVRLLNPVDAYEMSFVAVPSQPGAGVTKSHEKTCWTTAELFAAKARLEIERERWN